MKKTLKIGNKLIGEGQPCFIIAEAGINHNGRLSLARKMIDAAKKAGADAIKFQTFKTENLVTPKAPLAKYQKQKIAKTDSQFKMLKKLELPYRDFIDIKKYCDKRKIIFLSTPHTPDAVDFLENLMPTYKIASGDLTNLPFLEKVSQKKKPIILSTGMATMKEIKEAVKTITRQQNDKIVLLHCTSNYPCSFKEVNLKAMQTLKKEFNFQVGYSDHTLGTLVSVMAVALGAKVFEKHFTLDKNLLGPDHKSSLESKELKEMISLIKDAEEALGSDQKKPTGSEKITMKVGRKSIIAKVAIPKGTVITEKMLIIKRPGTGLRPKYLSNIIGKKAKKGIRKNELIFFNLLSNK